MGGLLDWQHHVFERRSMPHSLVTLRPPALFPDLPLRLAPTTIRGASPCPGNCGSSPQVRLGRGLVMDIKLDPVLKGLLDLGLARIRNKEAAAPHHLRDPLMSI